jgi:cytochrome c oxidase subunit 2
VRAAVAFLILVTSCASVPSESSLGPVSVLSVPGIARAGDPIKVTITLPNDSPVSRLHLFVLGRDTGSFEDLHINRPTERQDVTVRLPAAGRYWLQLRGPGEFIGQRMTVDAVGAPALENALPELNSPTTVNGVTLEPTTLSPLPAGVALVMGFAVTDANGSAIGGVASEHLVLASLEGSILKESISSAYAGGHGEMDALAQGALAYDVTLPSAGKYLAFLRARVGDTSVAAAFAYEVGDIPVGADVDAGHAGHGAAEMDPRKVRDIAVEAFQYGYAPTTIRVREGDHVRLRLSSRDVPHSFTLPAYDVNATVLPGDEQVVEFMADIVGRFPFTCDVFCGAGHGAMAETGGWLIVDSAE